jgi:hypothetical protein
MSEEKRRINLTTGNWITISVLVVGAITAWAKIQMHITDETIHLTEEQRENLTKFRTIFDEKIPTIEKNEVRIYELDKEYAVFLVKFENLRDEHEGLETKVSRNYTEIRDKIEE